MKKIKSIKLHEFGFHEIGIAPVNEKKRKLETASGDNLTLLNKVIDNLKQSGQKAFLAVNEDGDVAEIKQGKSGFALIFKDSKAKTKTQVNAFVNLAQFSSVAKKNLNEIANKCLTILLNGKKV